MVQFVHEPLAALYGYLRGTKDSASAVRGLMRRNILVVDWGGGTLDLTLCRLMPGRILQLRNQVPIGNWEVKPFRGSAGAIRNDSVDAPPINAFEEIRRMPMLHSSTKPRTTTV